MPLHHHERKYICRTSKTSKIQSSKRQVTMNNWFGIQRDTSNEHHSVNQQTSQSAHPNAINSSTSAHTQRRNRHQSYIMNYLNQSAQQRPQNNQSHSSQLQDNGNVNYSENQQLKLRSSTNDCNLNRSSQRRLQLGIYLSSEGSQIFKRMRLK